MNLEGIMLSEICQMDRDKYHMISLMCRIYKKKRQIGGCQRCGVEEMGALFCVCVCFSLNK